MADDVTIQSFLYKFDDAEAAGFGGCAQNTAHSPESEAGIAFSHLGMPAVCHEQSDSIYFRLTAAAPCLSPTTMMVSN
jgi:hypothetical protein